MKAIELNMPDDVYEKLVFISWFPFPAKRVTKCP